MHVNQALEEIFKYGNSALVNNFIYLIFNIYLL